MRGKHDHYHKENEWGVCRICAQTAAKLQPAPLPLKEVVGWMPLPDPPALRDDNKEANNG